MLVFGETAIFFFFFGGKFDRSKPDPPPPRAHTLRRRPDSRFRSPVLGGRSSGAGAMSANGRYGLDLDASDSEDDDVMRLPGETISKTSPRPRSSSSDASDTTSNEPMPMRVSAEVAFLGEVDGAPSVHRSARKTPSKPALGHALANDLFDVGRFGLGDFFPTRDSRSPRHESGAAGVGPGADALAAAAALRRELAASTNTAQRRVDRKRTSQCRRCCFADLGSDTSTVANCSCTTGGWRWTRTTRTRSWPRSFVRFRPTSTPLAGGS